MVEGAPLPRPQTFRVSRRKKGFSLFQIIDSQVLPIMAGNPSHVAAGARRDPASRACGSGGPCPALAQPPLSMRRYCSPTCAARVIEHVPGPRRKRLLQPLSPIHSPADRGRPSTGSALSLRLGTRCAKGRFSKTGIKGAAPDRVRSIVLLAPLRAFGVRPRVTIFIVHDHRPTFMKRRSVRPAWLVNV